MAKKTFGERVTELRENHGWLQRDLAFRMGVKANTISNWEKGISRPNLDQLCQLCQILSVTSDSLLGLTDTPMERTLSLPEQTIISTYRGFSKEMQDAIRKLISQIHSLQGDAFFAECLAEGATQFIKDCQMEEEWEEYRRENVPDRFADD